MVPFISCEFFIIVVTLCLQKHGGEELDTTYLNQDRVILFYKLPLSNVIVGFYDELKMISSGYAR